MGVGHLAAGDTILVRSGQTRAYLDLSQRGRCLNLSLMEKRKEANLDYYLERMPALKELSEKRRLSFPKTRIFLIHHITGEILATIQALENMGCDFLHVFFVKYAGVVPGDYLEALLSLPEESFFFSGLQRIESKELMEGYYVLSSLYSKTDGLEALAERLSKGRLAYFAAMKYAAGHLFFREAILAKKKGQRLLLIEDGGYLAPTLNELCLKKQSLAEALALFGLESDDLPSEERQQGLWEWLDGLLPHTVEHTRNGFNRLEHVEKKYGKLAFPAASIAISDTKRNRESEEVSISILHAIESILHGQGKVFSERKALVLGSRGAIGSNLMEDLSAKLTPEKVIGIDLEAPRYDRLVNIERSRFSKLSPGELAGVDVVIGVTGQSIIKKRELERLILASGSSQFWFASGSTKTAEFSDLSALLDRLHRSRAPRLCGHPIDIERENLHDPQTRHIVASRIGIRFLEGEDEASSKSDTERSLGGQSIELFLLGGLTPINFLFYGVPTETMDAILTQLLQVSSGMFQKIQNGLSYEPRLLAVDRDITPDAELL